MGIIVLMIVLLAICLVAPFIGVDTTDARSERARPETGWFPPLSPRSH
jgi:hypothetical protein